MCKFATKMLNFTRNIKAAINAGNAPFSSKLYYITLNCIKIVWSIQKKQRIISTVLLCFAFDSVLQILGTHFLPCRANETSAWYVCSSFTKYVPRLYKAWIVRGCACSKWQFFSESVNFPSMLLLVDIECTSLHVVRCWGRGKGPARAWRISAGQMEQTISQASVERPTHAKPLTQSTAWGLGQRH